MDYSPQTSLVPCGQDKYISKNELLLHLKTYNLYYEGQNLQLRHREEEDEFIVEGLLNISWGLRRPIRLQMQDDNERIRPPPSSSSWHSGCNLGAQGTILKPLTMPNIQISEVDAPESDQTPSPTDSRGLKPVQEDTPQLMRTRSDVGVRRRGNVRTPSDQRRIRRHRFSINGHFYNHKTSVFTPAYGSVTNVRINSTMTTPQVLKLLLNKFKASSPAVSFSTYVVKTSGQTQHCPCLCVISEKQKLKTTDYPLIARILQGPCEQVSKVFLMEKDQVEEVTYDVAQYIKFEMPVLKSFIQKLQEEEDREVKKLMRKYTVLRLMIRQRLEEIAETPAAI
ncbi:PREDICTED: ras association domain-containing protein 2 [Dipodomys ordii]|uniref:Ras association domain-containing protein 2 n=1 Tax=Dipodomys ordii TaxID=10020 RepID=A0A1S3ERA8_DIPOR|nr:PREDICTED: ras association domain-containing protein 2 [Dipodomys ordii]